MNVTITGIDQYTNIAELPIECEIAALYSCTNRGNRYPSHGFILQAFEYLHERGQDTALHLCGQHAKQMAASGLLASLFPVCSRIQINGVITYSDFCSIAERFGKPIITQVSQAPELIGCDYEQHQLLVDDSAGNGVLPGQWHRPKTKKRVGFAGGLHRFNLATELTKIKAIAGADFWIDVETGVRVDDWFDTGIARKFLQMAKAWGAGK